MTTTTGDAETIRQLAQTVREHHGDTEAWARFGRQLAAQRISRGHGNRTRFARERIYPTGIATTEQAAAKLAYDLEGGIRWGRQSWPPDVLIAIAEAYEVALESVGPALAGGELIPAPAPAPVLAAAPDPEPADGPPPAVLMSGVLSPAAIAAAAPYATEILVRLRDLAVAGIMRPSGRQLFPGADDEASIWDRNANDMPDDELAWLIAGRRALETSARRDRTVVLTPVVSAG